MRLTDSAHRALLDLCVAAKQSLGDIVGAAHSIYHHHDKLSSSMVVRSIEEIRESANSLMRALATAETALGITPVQEEKTDGNERATDV